MTLLRGLQVLVFMFLNLWVVLGGVQIEEKEKKEEKEKEKKGAIS